MRRCIMSVALLAASVAAGCTDNPPTSTGLRPDALTSSASLAPTQSLSDFIDEQIAEVFKHGHAASVASRWSTVKKKKAAGDIDGAKKHFVQLADWITKTTQAKTLPEETAELVAARVGATRLVYAMSLWVFVGEDAAVPVIGGDSKAEVVPAGEPATVVTESKRAGVKLDEGSTAEDRVIVVVEDPSRYQGHCNGPLNTVLCQYPQFYKFESFPKTKLLKRGRFAVCMVTVGDRRPLDYSDDDPRANDPDHPHAKEEVHERLQLAHDKPDNPNDFTEGSTIVDGIEILPRALNQDGFTECDRPIEYGAGSLPPVRGGWFDRSHRMLMAIASFTGRLLTPKNAYAYDRGPEHESIFFSSFNAVDPASQPDLRPVGITAPAEVWRGDAMSIGATVTNKSRRQPDGNATAASVATSVSIYLVRDVPGEGEGEVVTEEVRLCNSAEEACAFAVAALRPDVTDPAIGGALFSLLVPEDVDPGHWFVEVRVAASGRLEEADSDNNVARSSSPILIKKKLPDLTFQAGFTITSPATVRAGGTITTSAWTVANIGNAVSGPFDARFYLRSASGALRAIGGAIAHNPIGFQPDANSATHDGVELTIPSDVQPGTYDVLLRLDPSNDVEELRDDNNEAAPQQLVVERQDVPLALNLTAVEKLPGGTQRFTVQEGEGPFTWSVNGIDGGNATFGTITAVSANAADYNAPAAVPDPATFDVCARRDANPSNSACAAVTIRPIPSSGTDVVVFNDINFFDNSAATNANNIRLFANLVDYTAPGARATEKGVMIHFGHNSVCCGPSYIQTLIDTYNNRGNPVTVVNTPAATITSVPATIKLLYLILPGTPYSDAEINVLKAFASEGGRIVFVGEHGGFYPSQIEEVENPFFKKMGAELTNTGALINCGYHTLPQSSLRSHQITQEMTNVTMACASKISLGPNDYALVHGTLDENGNPCVVDGVNICIVAAVARIDVTPLPAASLAAKSAPLLSSAPAPKSGDEDPVGAKYAPPPKP